MYHTYILEDREKRKRRLLSKKWKNSYSIVKRTEAEHHIENQERERRNSGKLLRYTYQRACRKLRAGTQYTEAPPPSTRAGWHTAPRHYPTPPKSSQLRPTPASGATAAISGSPVWYCHTVASLITPCEAVRPIYCSPSSTLLSLQ